MLFGLYGPSRAGKTTLINALLHARNDICLLKSCTTRQARVGSEDYYHYRYCREREFQAMIKNKQMATHMTYAGAMYGFLRSDIRLITRPQGRSAKWICAVTEDGIEDLQKQGVQVVPIQIVPEDVPENILAQIDADRRAADQHRLQNSKIRPAVVINNSFRHESILDSIASLFGFLETYSP